MNDKDTIAKPTFTFADLERLEPRHISLTEARQKSLDASEKAQQAQAIYASEEAQRLYDYRVDE